MIEIKTEGYSSLRKEAIGQYGLGLLTRILDTNTMKRFLSGTGTEAIADTLKGIGKEQLVDAKYIIKETSNSLHKEFNKIVENINSKSELDHYPVFKELLDKFKLAGGAIRLADPLSDQFKEIVDYLMDSFSGGQNLYRELITREEYVGKLRGRATFHRNIGTRAVSPTYSEKGRKYQEMLYREVHTWLIYSLVDLLNRAT